MADDWVFHGGGKTAARQPKPGELLFEFVRASDRAPMSCELRFHGESYGWEVQFFERGEWLYGHGGFVTRQAATGWAQIFRDLTKGRQMKFTEADKAAAAKVLTDYYQAFSTLDAQAVLSYFHEPSQLVGPAGVVPTPTRAAVVAVFQPVMDALRARGFAKSELTHLHLKGLSAATAIAGGVAVRRKTDGQELERAGVVYLMQKTGAGWQIATIVIHDADDALRPA